MSRVPRDIRVNERGGTPPVLVGRIRVEDLGPELPVELMGQDAILATGLGFGLFPVGERKYIRRMQEIHVGMGIARGLRETVVEASTPAPCNMRHDPVKRDPA